jgi:exonuclease-1
MGISGLLPKLKSVTERTPITSLRGKTVAVDAYCILHKGAYSCSRELVEGIRTDKCTNYCIRRIEALIEAGVVPYVVFDGGPLPNKKDEEDARHASRAESLQKARHLWQQGSKVAAMEFYQRAVDITPEIANTLAQELKARNIKFVIAPYEADAQCAYLAINGFVDAVLTEDSDLICYGCSDVLLKFDGSVADRVRFADLAHCRELSFVGWDLYMFQQMCVLAGCDFVKALPGIGVKKAHAHMRRTRSVERVIRGLRFDGIKVPVEYAAKVQRALWTFKYQRVYCPSKRCVVNLHDIPELGLESDGFCPEAAVLVGGEADFLGKDIPRETAQGIAEGRLHPVTWLPFATLGGGRKGMASAGSATLPSWGSGSRGPQSTGSGHHPGRGQPGGSSLIRRMVMTNQSMRHSGGKDNTATLSQPRMQQSQDGRNGGPSQSSRPPTHIRKPNGQLMLNLQAMKHGLKRALGEYEAEDGDKDGMEYGKEDVENTDANNESAMMQEPLWMPAVAPVRAKGGRATCSSTDAYERQKKARESVTPVRSLDLVYDGFESPTVTANEGSLFSSRKYRQQTAVDQSLYYASVERDAATSTERIVALWGPNNTSGAEHAGDEKGNPFASFKHK